MYLLGDFTAPLSDHFIQASLARRKKDSASRIHAT